MDVFAFVANQLEMWSNTTVFVAIVTNTNINAMFFCAVKWGNNMFC